MLSASILPAALLALSLWGDVVLLKNGNEIQGEVLEESEDRVVVRFPGGTLELRKKDVEAIRRQSRLDYLTEEGEKFLLRGDSEGAVDLYREALREAPASVKARDGLKRAHEERAASLAKLGRYGEARAAYEALLKSEPSNARAREEIRVIEETLKEAQREEERGRAEIEGGDLEKGSWRLELIYDRFPERREAVRPILSRGFLRQGDKLLSRGDWRGAEGSYLKALSVDPEVLPELRRQYATAKVLQIEPLVRAGDFALAGKAAAEGLEIDPASEVLRYHHGLALEAEGKAREAAEEYLSITDSRRPSQLESAVEKLRHEAEAKLLEQGDASPTAHPRAREVLPGAYRELSTRHFAIQHKNEPVARDVALVSERAYEKIFRDLECATHLRNRITIFVFPTREEYMAQSGMQSWSGGAHMVGRRMGSLSEHRIYSFQDQPRLTTGVLPHEVAHALFTHRLNYPESIPLWATEGYAVLNEPDYFHRHYNRILQQEMARKTLIPVRDLVKRATYPAENVECFYGQCYSLVEFLVSLEGLQNFLTFVKDSSGARQDLESSLRRFYGLASLLALENRWLGWFEYSRR